jgi:cytochrome c
VGEQPAAPTGEQPSAPAATQPPAAAPAPELVAQGQQQFELQCTFCHDGTSGPELEGVAGRKIAGTDFTYSDALKAKSSETWTDANLDAFLKDTQGFAPGSKMMMTVPDDANRAAVIAYLKTLK